jgi:AcrR family transcriptional regulator
MNATSLRERKKQEVRTAISDVATRLFVERGFDNVTVAEIAEAANVSTMTVFNHFQKKEDLFFDREGQLLAFAREAFAGRQQHESPVDVLHRLTHDVLRKKLAPTPESLGFWDAVAKSASLRARAREMRDHGAENLAEVLAAAVGKSTPDAEARLIALHLVAAWQTALQEGIRLHHEGASTAKTRNTIQRLLNRGLQAVSAAAAATPYERGH